MARPTDAKGGLGSSPKAAMRDASSKNASDRHKTAPIERRTRFFRGGPCLVMASVLTSVNRTHLITEAVHWLSCASPITSHGTVSGAMASKCSCGSCSHSYQWPILTMLCCHRENCSHHKPHLCHTWPLSPQESTKNHFIYAPTPRARHPKPHRRTTIGPYRTSAPQYETGADMVSRSIVLIK